jgi:glycerophosphoryl diester phosphodiesterase
MISYDEKALAYARTKGISTIGWVISKWEQQAQEIANDLNPEYLICNHTKLPAPPSALWPGHWQWVVYEVTEPLLALDLANRSIAFVETMEIADMLKHPALNSKRCNDS